MVRVYLDGIPMARSSVCDVGNMDVLFGLWDAIFYNLILVIFLNVKSQRAYKTEI